MRKAWLACVRWKILAIQKTSTWDDYFIMFRVQVDYELNLVSVKRFLSLLPKFILKLLSKGMPYFITRVSVVRSWRLIPLFDQSLIWQQEASESRFVEEFTIFKWSYEYRQGTIWSWPKTELNPGHNLCWNLRISN